MSEEFATEVLRIAVAQIIKAFGFGAAEKTALDTLTDIVRACSYFCSHKINDLI